MLIIYTRRTITLFFLSILFGTVCSAQTGVNTKNPLHPLHVDGKGDNPSTTPPNALQQSNDVVITSNGDVGIGLLIPGAKLDVNGRVRIGDLQKLTTKPKKVIVADDEGNLYYTDVETIAPPVEDRIYSIINKNARQRLATKSTYYPMILDGAVNGVNNEKLTISADKTRIQLPPNKTLKISGSIGIIGANETPTTTNAAYIVSQFDLENIHNDGSQLLVRTIGYTESSTERYDDGGVSMPIIIVRTGNIGANVFLRVKYDGSDAPANGYYIGGEPGETTIGSYILVEEI
ncbi:hypothetical protein [Sphingobacterium sp. MYb382]|uniref:hypothetical protein n=1 Tax=Sphingobacterium sp. MYb382 TaxID=2745278 RepID=UPI003099F279